MNGEQPAERRTGNIHSETEWKTRDDKRFKKCHGHYQVEDNKD